MTVSTALRIFVLSFLSLGLFGATASLAGEADFTCPDLSTAEQLGACPDERELKQGYDATCPSAMGRRNECKPFAAYVKSKNKSLWGVKTGGEEFLPYVRCSLSPETVRASRAQSVEIKCAASTGRCEARCGYENDFTLRLRFQGECRTANRGKIDCQDDPKACVFTCETFE